MGLYTGDALERLAIKVEDDMTVVFVENSSALLLRKSTAAL